MPIDPLKVQWDKDKIDTSKIQWDEDQPTVRPPVQSPVTTEKKPPFIATRPAWTAIGGSLGAVAGVPLSPIGGPIAGGALGAATGSILFDNFQAVKAYVEGRSQDIPTGGKVAKTALREGLIDASFGMGASVVRPVLWTRQALGWLSGVTKPEAEVLARNAERFGISLGATDVGGILPKGYAKAVGVFPWTGTPLRKAELAKLKQARGAVHDILNELAPNATISDLGVNMVKAAKNTRQEFRNTATALYKNVTTVIENAARQDIVPTDTVRKLAIEMGESAKQGKIILKDGKELPEVAAKEVLEYIKGLAILPEVLTPTQYRRLTKDLSNLFSKNIKDGFDIKQLEEVKKALELDFGNLRVDLLPQGEGELIKDALDAANTFYSKGIVDFQTPTAQKFMRVDKNIFRAGAEVPKSLNADELAKVVTNLKSPQAMRDLYKLVGKGNMKQITSNHLENAVAAARTEVVMMGKPRVLLDPVKFEKALGLTKKNDGLKELFRISGANIDDIKGLVHVMKSIEDIANPAEFVRRRAVLGGAKGTVTALAGFGGAVGGASLAGGAGAGGITVGALTLLSRHISKIFASPVKLKLMKVALDEARSTVARQAALGRVVKVLTQEGGYDNLQETVKKGVTDGEVAPLKAKDYGKSDQPEGTTATNAEGIKIITKNGVWVEM